MFFYGPDSTPGSPAGLFEAHDFISNRLGNGQSFSHVGCRVKCQKCAGAGVIFALALVCAGQTSSITVTLAGQIVSEGFIEWKVSVCKLLRYQSHHSILIPPPGFISLALSPKVDHTVH